MLTRTYLATLASEIVGDLTHAGFDVRASDSALHFAARDAAQALLTRRPSLTGDRDDIETAIVSELLDWREEWRVLDAEVYETYLEMRAADGPF